MLELTNKPLFPEAYNNVPSKLYFANTTTFVGENPEIVIEDQDVPELVETYTAEEVHTVRLVKLEEAEQ